MNYDVLFQPKIIRSLNAHDASLLKDYLMKKKGWVYVAKSKNNDLFKIGRTGKSPFERAESLETTGVLYEYDIVFALPVFNQFIAEAKVHKRLKKFRVRKEFFALNEIVAIEAVKKEYDIERKLLDRFIALDVIEDDLDLLESAIRQNW